MKGIEGSTLGRYELRRRVARGGMSEVYLGYDRRVRRLVAVKVLYGSDEPFVRRFEREALAVGALSHDHILSLFDFGEQRPWYYLVMPYVEGGTLRDYLIKRERLTLEEAGSFLEQIASALQYAHDNNVIHRDVKPSNILLRLDGHAYLVDFGLAKAKMKAESLTHPGSMVGTPEYMAPEQSNGLNDYRSDIYSLGIILYQMLTGRVPFIAESPVAISLKHIQTQPTPPRQLNSDIPQSIEDIILRALAKDPDERYQEAKALATAYKKALQQELIRTQAVESASATTQEEQDEQIESPLKENAVLTPTTEISPSQQQDTSLSAAKPRLFPLGKQAPSLLTRADTHWREKHIHPRLIILLCLILISSVLPISLIWRVHDAPQSTPIVPTSNTKYEATALAHAKLQAAQARVQATAGITSALGAGKVLYASDMKSPGGGWIDDGYQCFFSPHGYHVYTALTHAAAWCYSNQQQFADAVITAQAQLLRGDIYGLIFRLNPANRAFYVLEINSQGEYRLVRALGSNPLNWLTLIDWTPSSAILSGYRQTNTFLVVATGATFRFYINKQLIVSAFSDTTYTSGLIGLLVGGDSSGGTEAIFSNIWIFQK